MIKCECGAEKTFGTKVGNVSHSNWCPASSTQEARLTEEDVREAFAMPLRTDWYTSVPIVEPMPLPRTLIFDFEDAWDMKPQTVKTPADRGWILQLPRVKETS